MDAVRDVEKSAVQRMLVTRWMMCVVMDPWLTRTCKRPSGMLRRSELML